MIKKKTNFVIMFMIVIHKEHTFNSLWPCEACIPQLEKTHFIASQPGNVLQNVFCRVYV